jgi:hypothetical protein
MLGYYHKKGFASILVNFNIPDDLLKERVAKSQRSTTILRVASSFEEVLARQQADTNKGNLIEPIEGESDHLFEIKNAYDVESVIKKIINILDD